MCIRDRLYNSTTKAFTAQTAAYRQHSYEAYADYGTASLGDLWYQYSSDDATVKLKRHNGTSTLSISSSAAISDTATTATGHTSGTTAIKLNINDKFAVNGASGYVNVTFHNFDSDSDGNLSVDDMVQAINSALSSATAANTDCLLYTSPSPRD